MFCFLSNCSKLLACRGFGSKGPILLDLPCQAAAGKGPGAIERQAPGFGGGFDATFEVEFRVLERLGSFEGIHFRFEPKRSDRRKGPRGLAVICIVTGWLLQDGLAVAHQAKWLGFSVSSLAPAGRGSERGFSPQRPCPSAPLRSAPLEVSGGPSPWRCRRRRWSSLRSGATTPPSARGPSKGGFASAVGLGSAVGGEGREGCFGWGKLGA